MVRLCQPVGFRRRISEQAWPDAYQAGREAQVELSDKRSIASRHLWHPAEQLLEYGVQSSLRIGRGRSAAPGDIAVGPDQHGAIDIDAVSGMPVAVGVADLAVRADHMRDQWRPRWRSRLRCALPCRATAASEQREVRAEQIEGRYLLIAAFDPDMRGAAAGACRGDIFGDGIADGGWRRAVG